MKQMKKSNHRSFRYTNETAMILEEFNNDLDELVWDAYYRLPELREEIVLEQEALQNIQSEALKVKQNIQAIHLTGLILSSIMEKLLLISRRLDDVAAGRLFETIPDDFAVDIKKYL